MEPPPSHSEGDPSIPKLSFESFFSPAIERGAVLSAVADLDAAMAACLRRAFIQDATGTVDQLFTAQGTLGSYGMRRRFIFALGLVTLETYKELGVIGDIRNVFAHYPEVENFKHPAVQGYASALLALKDILALKKYFKYGEHVPGTWSESTWDIATKAVVEKGIDISEPRWAFSWEVGLFYSCFRRLLKEQNFKLHFQWF